MQNTVHPPHMDVGSAENAGAISCRGHNLVPYLVFSSSHGPPWEFILKRKIKSKLLLTAKSSITRELIY